MDVPCEKCVLLAICIEPNKFADIYYGCSCSILEEAITKDGELSGDGSIRSAYKVHDWYRERTGNSV